MASKYKKPRSPYWYLQFTDKDGIRRNKSSGLRHGDPRETAEADVLVARLSVAEVQQGMGGGEPVARWEFATKYIRDHCRSEKTFKNYSNRWDWINLFLSEEKLRSPENVAFKHGQQYVDWRVGYKKKSGRTVCRNTAILEVKLFSQVMQHAVRLGLCQTNPLVRLGIAKDLPPEKPEITAEEFKVIEAALEKEPEWMRVSWYIAKYTGCRLRETALPMSRIDFENGTIELEPKGGKKRAFSVAMPAKLRPLLESLRDGRTHTTKLAFQPSRQWQHFFRRVKMPHLVFHCLRVTFITRLARTGVPLSAAMRMVNHATQEIHRIYQRLNVEDVRRYADAAY